MVVDGWAILDRTVQDVIDNRKIVRHIFLSVQGIFLQKLSARHFHFNLCLCVGYFF